MKRRSILWVGIALFLLILLQPPLRLSAATAPTMAAPSGLSFLQFKATGEEYVVLQNNTGADIPDLSRYAVYYFNNVSPLSAGTSTSSQMLPASMLASGQSIMLSSNPRATCGAAIAGDLSLSLGDSSGFLQIVELGVDASGAITQIPGDVVSWSSGPNGLIQNMPSNTKDPAAAYYRYIVGATYPWQYANIDTANPCMLNAIVIDAAVKNYVPTDATLINSSDEVPGVIVKLAPGTQSIGNSNRPTMPAANIGLKAPKISELLPNVKAPAKDANDEFIELYNPNDKIFDLSGFILQTGSMSSETRHNFTIPKGTLLPAKGFKALYSKDTGLSLNNSGGQVWLLDPFGTKIGESEPYSKPKDGMAWATASNKWYYTTTPSPDASNKITEPAVGGAAAKSKTAKTTKGTPVTKVASASGAVAGVSSSANADQAAATMPIHPSTLAIVIGIGLLYLCYEYRHDLANKIHQFRANRANRR